MSAREEAARAVETIRLARTRIRIRSAPCARGGPHELVTVTEPGGTVVALECARCCARWTAGGDPCPA